MVQEKKRILLVEDHPLVRLGLSALLGGEHDLEICGEAVDPEEALRQIDQLRPDLAIVDISLKNGNGLDLTQQIRDNGHNTRILVASMHDDVLFAERALRAGAQGYINKAEEGAEIINAVRQVLSNRIYLSADMAEVLLRGARPERRNGPPNVDRLSERERTVFEQIGHGKTTRQIAEQLGLSIKTVETYRENIKAKLNLANAAELSRCAVQWVLKTTPDR